MGFVVAGSSSCLGGVKSFGGSGSGGGGDCSGDVNGVLSGGTGVLYLCVSMYKTDRETENRYTHR